jgi:hypothetical protein
MTAALVFIRPPAGGLPRRPLPIPAQAGSTHTPPPWALGGIGAELSFDYYRYSITCLKSENFTRGFSHAHLPCPPARPGQPGSPARGRVRRGRGEPGHRPHAHQHRTGQQRARVAPAGSGYPAAAGPAWSGNPDGQTSSPASYASVLCVGSTAYVSEHLIWTNQRRTTFQMAYSLDARSWTLRVQDGGVPEPHPQLLAHEF